MALTAKPYLQETSIDPAARFDPRPISCQTLKYSCSTYEDTEHYAITRDFLNHYQRRLQQLLGDQQDDE